MNTKLDKTEVLMTSNKPKTEHHQQKQNITKRNRILKQKRKKKKGQ